MGVGQDSPDGILDSNVLGYICLLEFRCQTRYKLAPSYFSSVIFNPSFLLYSISNCFSNQGNIKSNPNTTMPATNAGISHVPKSVRFATHKTSPATQPDRPRTKPAFVKYFIAIPPNKKTAYARFCFFAPVSIRLSNNRSILVRISTRISWSFSTTAIRSSN